MVTTRHTSYSPEAQDTASNTPASAHTAKRRAANMEQPSTSAASKKRKVGQSQPQKITIAAAPNQATRIRFGSEEPVIPIQVVKDTDAEDEEEENEDSDDEAPEDISASAAQLHTEEAEAAAARAIEQQQAIDRRKRQARSAKLETQAMEKKKKESAKPVKSSNTEVAQPDESASEGDDDDEEVAEEEEGPLLLPEELLAASFVRPPTPPPIDPSARMIAKSKVIKLDDAPPKDRKIGPVVVSVLPKTNKLLPPKASGPSMNLREKWLAGKRKGQGKGAGIAVERKAFGGGFVKR